MAGIFCYLQRAVAVGSDAAAQSVNVREAHFVAYAVKELNRNFLAIKIA